MLRNLIHLAHHKWETFFLVTIGGDSPETSRNSLASSLPHASVILDSFCKLCSTRLLSCLKPLEILKMTSRFTNELPLAYGKRDHGASDLIDSLRSSLPQADAGGSYNREKVKELASKLSIALETPGETVQRIAFLVGLCSTFFSQMVHFRDSLTLYEDAEIYSASSPYKQLWFVSGID